MKGQVTNINFRMDADLKKSMEDLCAQLGLNLTTAFTIFAKAMVREGGIPFSVKIDPFYSESNINHLKKVIHKVEDGEAELINFDDLEE